MKNLNLLLIKGIFLLLVGASLAPYLMLCLYNHPSADDFTYSNWDSFVGRQFDFYNNLNGRYFTTFALSFDPVHFHSFLGYKIATALFILLFSYCLFLFIRKFTQIFISSNSWVAYLIYAGTLFLILDLAESLAEGFYWEPAVICYLLPLSLLFLLGIFLISIFREGRYSMVYLCALLLFCIVGSSEVIMFVADTIIFILFLYQIFRGKNKKITAIIISLLIASIIFSLVVVLSPGNYHRAQSFVNPQDTMAVPKPSIVNLIFHSMGGSIFRAFKSPIFLSFTAIYYLVFLKAKGPTHFIKFWFCLILTFALMVILILPVGIIEKQIPLRVENLMGYAFVTFWPILIFSLSKEHKIIQISFFLCLAVIIACNKGAGIRSGNYSLAWNDLMTGKAARYDQELNQRDRLLTQTHDQDIIVPALSEAPPDSLYFSDITPNPYFWHNVDYAKFWHKDSIKSASWDYLKNI